MFFHESAKKIVNGQILKLKNGKATGLDGIGTKHLIAGSPVLSIYLTQIFNLKGQTHETHDFDFLCDELYD